LGWPEYPPRTSDSAGLPPEPKKSDYVSTRIDDHGQKLMSIVAGGFSLQGPPGDRYNVINEEMTSRTLAKINSDFEKYRGYIVTAISTRPPDREQVITNMEICNKIIDNMESFNLQMIQRILGDHNPKARTEFAAKYNIRVEDIPTFKLPGYNVQTMREKLGDTIDEFFPRIHSAWLDNLPAVHFRLPEPNLSDFVTDEKPIPEVKLDYSDGGFVHALKTATNLTTRYCLITNEQSSEYITQGPVTWWFESPSSGS